MNLLYQVLTWYIEIESKELTMTNLFKFTQKKLIVFLSLTIFCFISCGGESKVIKYLRNELNDSVSRYWADFIEENGINAIDIDSDTLLYFAVEQYKDPYLVDLCLNAKADYNLVPRGKIPLVARAYQVGHYDILEVLFKHGAPVRSDNENYKYDLLYSAFSGYKPEYAQFLLSYYTEKELDYRDYVPLTGLGWTQTTNEVFFEMDKKGYKPHNQNVIEFINDYVRLDDEVSLKTMQFTCLQKYIKDTWYKENNRKIIDTNSYFWGEYENEARVFQVLTEFIKNGYNLEEDIGVVVWVKNAFDNLANALTMDYYEEYENKLEYFLKIIDFCNEYNANPDKAFLERQSYQTPDKKHILDEYVCDFYNYKIDSTYQDGTINYDSFAYTQLEKYEKLITILLENGINTVSATYKDEYGEDRDFESIIEFLKLTDKVVIDR